MRISRFCFESYALYAAAVVHDELQNVRQVTAAEGEGRRLVALARIPLQRTIRMVVMVIVMVMIEMVAMVIVMVMIEMVVMVIVMVMIEMWSWS